MEKKTTFEMLIEELEKLDNGVYSNNGVNIDVKKGNEVFKSCNDTALISEYKIDVLYNGNNLYISINLDKDSSLYVQKNLCSGENNCHIYAQTPNNKYIINKKGISVINGESCYISNSILFKEIDNTCWLGYNVDNDKMYVYYNRYPRKYNKPYAKDGNDSFVKFLFDDFFIIGLRYYNKRVNDFITDFISYNSGPFQELAKNVEIKELTSNFSPTKQELIDIAKIYKTYKENLNLQNCEQELKEVYNFVVNLINNPEEAFKNNMHNMIQNIDLNDREALIKFKMEIDKVLETNSKTKKIKK